MIRADLTPAEFDLVRRSLASHADRQQQIAEKTFENTTPATLSEHAKVKRDARAEQLIAQDLLTKLTGPGT